MRYRVSTCESCDREKVDAFVAEINGIERRNHELYLKHQKKGGPRPEYERLPPLADSFGFRIQAPGECDECYKKYGEGYAKAVEGMFD